jgi:hypothetical protein
MDRAEASSVGGSLVAHLALFGLIALVAGRPIPEVPPPMEVSFVEGEVGPTSASPVQSPPEQGVAPEAGPTEDVAPTPAPPMPDFRPQPPLPQPAPTRTESPPVRERVQPPPSDRNAPGDRPRRSLIGDDILKGIGRDPSTSRSQQAPAALTGEARNSFMALIQRALDRCQEQTFPAPQARAIRVTVRVTLNRDGSLASASVARVSDYDPSLRQYEQRMRELALTVVRECTPIQGLPAQYYDVPRGWRQFSYQFPRRS